MTTLSNLPFVTSTIPGMDHAEPLDVRIFHYTLAINNLKPRIHRYFP